MGRYLEICCHTPVLLNLQSMTLRTGLITLLISGKTLETLQCTGGDNHGGLNYDGARSAADCFIEGITIANSPTHSIALVSYHQMVTEY